MLLLNHPVIEGGIFNVISKRFAELQTEINRY